MANNTRSHGPPTALPPEPLQPRRKKRKKNESESDEEAPITFPITTQLKISTSIDDGNPEANADKYLRQQAVKVLERKAREILGNPKQKFGDERVKVFCTLGLVQVMDVKLLEQLLSFVFPDGNFDPINDDDYDPRYKRFLILLCQPALDVWKLCKFTLPSYFYLFFR
jgi:hypothetical protein